MDDHDRKNPSLIRHSAMLLRRSSGIHSVASRGSALPASVVRVARTPSSSRLRISRGTLSRTHASSPYSASDVLIDELAEGIEAPSIDPMQRRALIMEETRGFLANDLQQIFSTGVGLGNMHTWATQMPPCHPHARMHAWATHISVVHCAWPSTGSSLLATQGSVNVELEYFIGHERTTHGRLLGALHLGFRI